MKLEFRINKEGAAHTDSKERPAGQVLYELSGKEDQCDGSCGDEVPRKRIRHRIRITQDGVAYLEWWNESLAPVICAVCGKGCEIPPIDCVAQCPYCG